MLKCLSCQDTSKGVSNEVDAFVLVQGIDQMQTYLLGHHLSKFLNGFVYLIFDAFDEKTVTIWTVDVHEVSCLLKIHAAALISVDKYHKRIHLSS